MNSERWPWRNRRVSNNRLNAKGLRDRRIATAIKLQAESAGFLRVTDRMVKLMAGSGELQQDERQQADHCGRAPAPLNSFAEYLHYIPYCPMPIAQLAMQAPDGLFTPRMAAAPIRC